ncbi:hypothetical protein BGY98DRAFT_932975 [Russula aff. rugulosa BPL654]|nr:hypothetical protein BGY98DRAFT_932975 [Russula aff. rugulosa BPL654]
MICVDQPERASYSPADVYMDPQLLLLQPLPPFDVTLPTTLVYSVACPVPFSTGPAYPGTALPHPAATLRTGKEFWEGVWCQDESHLSHMRHSQLIVSTHRGSSSSGGGHAFSISETAELFTNVGGNKVRMTLATTGPLTPVLYMTYRRVSLSSFSGNVTTTTTVTVYGTSSSESRDVQEACSLLIHKAAKPVPFFIHEAFTRTRQGGARPSTDDDSKQLFPYQPQNVDGGVTAQGHERIILENDGGSTASSRFPDFNGASSFELRASSFKY